MEKVKVLRSFSSGTMGSRDEGDEIEVTNAQAAELVRMGLGERVGQADGAAKKKD
jgi:hypothetical protein